MVRSLLIALLAVAAVASPASALVPLPAAPLPAAPEPQDATTEARCRLATVTQGPSSGPLPDLGIQLDPDGCIRELIDKVLPPFDGVVLPEAPAQGDGVGGPSEQASP